jgi:hypothetical protein
MSIYLKSFHVPKKVWAMLKRKRKRKKCSPKSMNKPMLKSMKKKREEKKKKEREKDSPYFQIKGNRQKERES